jgi:nitrogen fixation NifU-like protein
MDELRELYQATILDHNRKPRNFRAMENPDRRAEGYNPICGDRLEVFLKVAEDRVTEIAFQGSGCAISVASASLMTDFAKGRTLAEIEARFDAFKQLVTSPPSESVNAEGLGKFAVFSGVREFPMRVKCATLAWHTLRAAVDQEERVARTE